MGHYSSQKCKGAFLNATRKTHLVRKITLPITSSLKRNSVFTQFHNLNIHFLFDKYAITISRK